MTAPQFDAFTVAQRLGNALEAARVPYAIGGALALGVWSDPRGIYDVDINLRRWLVDMMGEDDERASALDAMLRRRHGA